MRVGVLRSVGSGWDGGTSVGDEVNRRTNPGSGFSYLGPKT